MCVVVVAGLLPAAGVVLQQGHRVQSAVQLGVVVEAALPLQLHGLFQQSLQASRRQHHRRRQICYTHTHRLVSGRWEVLGAAQCAGIQCVSLEWEQTALTLELVQQL